MLSISPHNQPVRRRRAGCPPIVGEDDGREPVRVRDDTWNGSIVLNIMASQSLSPLITLLHEVHAMMQQLDSDDETASGAEAGDEGSEISSSSSSSSGSYVMPAAAQVTLNRPVNMAPGAPATQQADVSRSIESGNRKKPYWKHAATFKAEECALMLRRLHRIEKLKQRELTQRNCDLQWMTDRVQGVVIQMEFFGNEKLDDGVRRLLLAGLPFRTTARRVARVFWSDEELRLLKFRHTNQKTCRGILVLPKCERFAKFWCQVLGYRNYQIFCDSGWLTRLGGAFDTVNRWIHK